MMDNIHPDKLEKLRQDAEELLEDIRREEDYDYGEEW